MKTIKDVLDEYKWLDFNEAFTANELEHIYYVMAEYGRQLQPESPVEDEAVLLLKEVMNYHLGNGEYNFSRLPYNERENESFDAWQKIKAKIKIFLKKQP